jgi:hypothetical protein
MEAWAVQQDNGFEQALDFTGETLHLKVFVVIVF